MTSTLGMVSTVGYSLAVVFAVIATIFYVTQHVRSVHDELTGRTAQREIAEMREGRRGRTFLGAASSAANSVLAAAQGAVSGNAGSGSLHVRNVERETDDMEHEVATGEVDRAAQSAAAQAEVRTTLLGADTTGATASEETESEAGTTLLTDVKPVPANSKTVRATVAARKRAVAKGVAKASSKAAAPKAAAESVTTLLSGSAAVKETSSKKSSSKKASDASESMTTLLTDAPAGATPAKGTNSNDPARGGEGR